MLLFATLNDEKVVDCLREGTEVSMEFVEVSFAHIDDQLQKAHKYKLNQVCHYKVLPQNLHIKDNPEKQSS